MNFLRFIILPNFHGEKIPALDGGIEESFYLLIVIIKLILLYSRLIQILCKLEQEFYISFYN